MTRGKYAARAQNRRDATEVTQTIEAYQRKVREQVAEIAKIKTELANAKANHSAAVQKLIAQRDEAVSPRLEVVEREAVTLREERDTALSDAKEIRKRWGRVIESIRVHGEKVHGMTVIESAEWLLTLLGEGNAVIAAGFMKDLRDKWPGDPTEAVLRIERAKGERRGDHRYVGEDT